MIFNPSDYTVVFLSYDEPNCEENYQHLLTLCPDALRVHGVKGSDTAHKEVALLSKTDSVIIVDGDNKVKPSFFTKTFNLLDSVDLSTSVLSYSAYNIVNGNCYGNGGIKVWPVSLLKSMKTHENAEDPSSVDFDFKSYLQLNYAGSDTDITASPLQAFRAGFREGIKLCMEDGQIVTHVTQINWKNYDRLWRWLHIGIDVTNGAWSIYGARLAYYMSFVHRGDFSKVKDFNYVQNIFNESTVSNVSLFDEINRVGVLLRKHTRDNRIGDVYSHADSKEFRDTVPCTIRSEQEFIKYQYNETPEVFFISNGEGNSDKNFELVKKKAPDVKRIDRVPGIHNAHIAAAKLATTDYFWVVDADAVLVDDFTFEFTIPFYEEPKVRVWRSKNPVNGLVYGNGGVKLLPRIQTILMDTSSTDMTTSISKLYEPIFKVSNITEFNIDAFSAWRSGFRECAKLASQVIDNSSDTLNRLNTWCTVGKDKPFGKETIAGANAGKQYGTDNKGNKQALGLINDYKWLREQYEILNIR